VTAIVEAPAESVVAEGGYLAVLFDPTRGWGEHVATLAAQYPHWISAPTEAVDREQILFAIVTDPKHLAWEVWRGSDIVGIILLTDISPLVDARLHFAFFDHSLTSKTRLLRRFLAYCFGELRFQRITVQVPDFVEPLISFYRRKLGFRYEGEALAREHPAVAELGAHSTGKMQHPNVWVASRGSRRERAHWHQGAWHDVVCLRITAPEFETSRLGALCPPQPSSPPPPASSDRFSVKP
jgi:RimJ/RimL family protein N-acetyltransferase